jgi:ribonucleoside-diphosphate reductase alpha chain
MQSAFSGIQDNDRGEAGLVIERRFTSSGKDPFDQFDWMSMDIEIRNIDGSLAHSIDGVTLPSGFEGVPGKVCAQKYLRKAGVPIHLRKVLEDGVPSWLQRSVPDEERLQSIPAEQRYGGEMDGRELFRRLAGTWTYWGWKHGYFCSETDARAYYDEMCYLICSQRSAPNSPQWFNTGLHWAYGIEGPAQGHHYVDAISGECRLSESAYEHPQPHACFIQSVEDTLVGSDDSIMGLWSREALLFKYGSGTGSNFSNIRGLDEPLSGGGQSSGLLSFLKIGDRAAGAIKSGGTTRRAAKMVTLDLDHPDIEAYIDWKVEEEEKVSALVIGSTMLRRHAKSLMAALGEEGETRFDPNQNPELKQAMLRAIRDGMPEPHIKRIVDLAKQGWTNIQFEQFDTDWQGEGYITVSGQNSNNSVRVPDSFMQAVADGADWNLYNRTEKNAAAKTGRTPEPCKTMPAAELWDKIAYTAWACADPGVQFDTTINEWHTCPEGGRINGSNPCSEYMFLDDTACNLASINLLKFYDTDNKNFQIEDFNHAVRLWTVTLEISVLMAQFPSHEIAKRSYDYRTLGLGYANIGSLLMHMGIPYDDPRGFSICGAITAMMCGESYATSAEMASFLGPFPGYSENEESMLRVMRNHRRAAYDAAPDEYEGLSVTPRGIDSKNCPNDLLESARASWDKAYLAGQEFGYRNAQTTVIAPTGTIGLVMGCDTTGVEPQFALVQFKTLAGGGMLRIINKGVTSALVRLGYKSKQIDDIVGHVMGWGNLEGCDTVSMQRLIELGFSQAELPRIEAAFGRVHDIRSAFAPREIGEEFCRDVLKLSNTQMEDPFFDTLQHLGFEPTEIEIANDYIYGNLTIEGAPHLKDSHLAVFDCATPCGKYGKRSIEWQAHVKMMAAAQPFISGAISKTINMSSDASIDDIREAYNLSHTTMNKACAVYRDSSKLSQPLMSQIVDTSVIIEDEEEHIEIATVRKAAEQVTRSMPISASTAKSVSDVFVQEYVAVRRTMPDERNSHTLKARVGGHTVYLTSSTYDDERVGEIMITTSKEGAAWRSLLNQFAIAVSIGLQYGVPLEAFIKSFTFQKFEPSGMVVGGSGRVKMATSLVDYIFRELAIKYLGRDELAHVSEEDLETTSISKPESTPDGVVRNMGEKRDIQLTLDAVIDAQRGTGLEPVKNGDLEADIEMRRVARERGFTGDICTDCGSSQMIRNGTCLKCNNCGATTGCS